MGHIGAAAQSVVGKRDPNATNDMMNGQVVPTGTPGAQTMADPNQGLNLGQRMFRGGAMGALSGMGQQQPRSMGMQSQINIPQAPQVSSDYFTPNKNGMSKGPRPNSMFFGG